MKRFLLHVGFYSDYFKHWIVQISLLALINCVKLMGYNSKFSIKYVLNNLIDMDQKGVNFLIDNGDIKYTENNNILYNLHEPSKDNYPTKTILYVGGRNSYTVNHEFASRISNYLGVKVISFQYDGYYGSGKLNSMTEESYLNSIEEVYNKFSHKTDIYVIGYSLGCYGAYLKNRKKTIMLISPFYSLEHAIRGAIKINEFNLNNVLKTKTIRKVNIHTFTHDLITPFSHLIDQFRNKGIKIIKHPGNHVSGLTNVLMDNIKEYIEEDHLDFGEIEMINICKV